jgi:diguanylate cyclase (GGDEF)-like protein
MRIRDNLPPGSTARVASARPVARARGADAASATSATSTAAQADQATFLGLNETELSPNVRAALQALLDEVGRLRQELEMTRKRISHLERMADEDSMLPIANRRAFVRELSRHIAFATRYATPSSLIYFDLDGFKSINDTYSHAAGDAALSHFADTLLAHVRESDVVGRLGGDEFGIILAHTDQVQAHAKATSLAKTLKASPALWRGRSIQLGFSYGAFELEAGENADNAMQRADEAMYVNKRAARA